MLCILVVFMRDRPKGAGLASKDDLVFRSRLLFGFVPGFVTDQPAPFLNGFQALQYLCVTFVADYSFCSLLFTPLKC
jgi:hypothetical protein